LAKALDVDAYYNKAGSRVKVRKISEFMGAGLYDVDEGNNL
jgi:hypothetical protein